MCIRDRYQRRVRDPKGSDMVATQYQTTENEEMCLSVDVIPERRQDPAFVWKLSTAVLAMVATAAIILAAVEGSHGSSSSSSSSSSVTPGTELVNDFGNPRVKGYTCGWLAPGPCSPKGGQCAGDKCACNQGYSGLACDWGPYEEPSTVPAYLNGKSEHTEEQLKRIQLAYGFANAVYWNLNEQDADGAELCPEFFGNKSATNTAMFQATDDEADTHAGATFVLHGEHSPSGQPEVMLGFRGTEFSKSVTEIEKCVGDRGCAFRALKTVLTDLDIRKVDLSWPNPDGTKVDLGYVHKGFYTAVTNFLKPMLDQALSYINHTDTAAPIVNVVGHSLGGALANIFASVLTVAAPHAQIYLTTFGSPRVGSALWVKNLEANPNMHILRVVNGDDVVSLVPTSVGLGDSVMHAGPQLSVGWTNVSAQCQGSKLKDTKSMYSLLKPSDSARLDCAVASVSDFHLNYGPNLQKFLKKQGFKGKPWCRATINVAMAF
eukprot:TRINITY_DN12636_c0_g1_i2.p1 TRINITY_DN12636_c0_g1~~TRINITY_DN12636_c0_g1_i2.p1  ORF type:complete len:490 (-),score=110.59 TRINITY_DN12636_c0_g1_i2:114-1583(-)